jgi:RNA polymerase sigma-70 factor (ECF subfamily)
VNPPSGIPDPDDDLLIRRAKRGDSSATDALLRRHYDSVRAVCHRIVINPADADDATQIALISIVRALPSFDGRSKFSTWIYRIATNAALDEIRRIRRRPIPSPDGNMYDSVRRDVSDPVDAQLDVSAALAQLPEDYRSAVVLRHIADLDYEEIAEVLGVPIGTVRSRISRGRSQLAQILGNPDADQERQTGAASPEARRENP